MVSACRCETMAHLPKTSSPGPVSALNRPRTPCLRKQVRQGPTESTSSATPPSRARAKPLSLLFGPEFLLCALRSYAPAQGAARVRAIKA